MPSAATEKSVAVFLEIHASQQAKHVYTIAPSSSGFSGDGGTDCLLALL
jgi:hypothetical protein